MSHFASAARPLLLATGRTSGHAWIAFHRCVEAYCRLSGERFSTVFARLGLAHGFTAASSPEVAPLQAALTDLVAAREDLLRRRATLVTLRRAQKKAGRRVPRCEELQALEARPPVATALQPAVGCWGWRALREGRLGARLPLAGADMPPAHGAAGGRLFVDARRGPPTIGVADALTGVLAGGPARALRTQSGSNILKSLEAGRTLAPVLAVPRRVWRSRRLRRFRQTVPWNGAKEPPMPREVCRASASAGQPGRYAERRHRRPERHGGAQGGTGRHRAKGETPRTLSRTGGLTPVFHRSVLDTRGARLAAPRGERPTMASARMQGREGTRRPAPGGVACLHREMCTFDLPGSNPTAAAPHGLGAVPAWGSRPGPLTEVRGLVVPLPGASGITVRLVHSVRSGHRRVVPSLPSSWRELLSHLPPTLRGLELQVDPVARLACWLILAHPVEPGWAACPSFDRPA